MNENTPDEQPNTQKPSDFIELETKINRINWRGWITLVCVAITALASAASVLISNYTWQEQKETRRAFIGIHELSIKDYETPGEFVENPYFLCGETEDLRCVLKTEPPAFGVIAVQIIIRNYGQNLASNLKLSIISIPVKESGDLGSISVAYGSFANDLIGKVQGVYRPFAWRIGKEHIDYYILIGAEYEDNIINKKFYQNFYYLYPGGKTNYHYHSLDHLKPDQKEKAIEHIRHILEDKETVIKYGKW